jgi:transcriptional regulator with XRE-family HTH domain
MEQVAGIFSSRHRAEDLLRLLGLAMPDRDQFGPRLRRERERRGISLQDVADATKVSVDLWEAMEENDFARWPSGIFARAFVRDYARVIGLDTDAVVDEFCRHFAVGDRRRQRLVQSQAEMIGHPYRRASDTDPLPAGRERRAENSAGTTSASAVRARYAPRAVAAAVDTAAICSLALVAARVTGLGFWPVAGATAITYQTAATVVVGSSLGSRVVDLLRTHAPALFAIDSNPSVTVTTPNS